MLFSLTAPLPTLVAAAQEGAPASPGGGLGSMLPLLVIMGVMFWLIVLRPQQKEKKERQKRLDALKKGDKVVSIGGIHGKVSDINVNEGTVKVEVAPKMTMVFSKAAIQTVNVKDQGKAADKADKGDKKDDKEEEGKEAEKK